MFDLFKDLKKDSYIKYRKYIFRYIGASIVIFGQFIYNAADFILSRVLFIIAPPGTMIEFNMSNNSSNYYYQ